MHPLLRQLGRQCYQCKSYTSRSGQGSRPQHAAAVAAVLASAAQTAMNESGNTSTQSEPMGTFQVSLKELSGKGKLRLDTFLAEQLPTVSRAKISASIKAGLITVNKTAVNKPARTVKGGDVISVSLLPPEPCTAIPEAIPLDIVYEDQHLIVVNKVAGMVVHISPGHSTGTLVNALLAHCGLPACDVASGSNSSSSGLLSEAAAAADTAAVRPSIIGGLLEDDLDEGEEEEEEQAGIGNVVDGTQAQTTMGTTTGSSSSRGIIRPGIVHRLDRGTSGLMVVAKSDFVHAHLCGQFKARTVSRIYNSLTTGLPATRAARVATNVLRDPSHRLKMAAAPYSAAGRGRTAASNYQVLEALAAGGAALVQWKLETGRTHQIRVHAKHIGHPLLGDDLYGPGHAAASRVVIGKRSSLAGAARAAVEGFGRPALHAKTLGFTHPVTLERLEFDSDWPEDFLQLYSQLRDWT